MTELFGLNVTELFGLGVTELFGLGVTELFELDVTELFGLGVTEMFRLGVTELIWHQDYYVTPQNTIMTTNKQSTAHAEPQAVILLTRLGFHSISARA